MHPVTLLSTGLLALMLGVSIWNLLAAPRLGRAGRGGWARMSPGAGRGEDAARSGGDHPERSRVPAGVRESSGSALAPRVSVLVPARNEESNLETTLPALLRSGYPELEILVLDDRSDDATATTARRIARERTSGSVEVRVLAGRPLPHGWVGKSWACQQLADAATGEVLVFCDADVTVRPQAVACTVAAMHGAGAGALTALPRQHATGWADSAVVPLVTQLPVLALLPLPLVARTRAPSLSMGNGQWMAFTREAYEDVGGHAAVRGSLLEDVELARRVKRAGHRLLVTLAPDLLAVRMYRTPREMREGFVKNIHVLTGRGVPTRVAALVIFLLVAVHPWAGVAAGAAGAWIPLVMLGTVRAAGVVLLRHEPRSVVLHPVGSITLVYLAFASWAAARRGSLRWKGRGVSSAREPGTVTARNA